MTLTEQEQQEIKDAATEWVGSNEDEEGQDTWLVLRMAYIVGATAATLKERERLRKLVEAEQEKLYRAHPTPEAIAGKKYCAWFLSLLSGIEPPQVKE